MRKRPVVFITLLTYDNLGVGYMAAQLAEAGFESHVLSPQSQPHRIFRIIKELDPLFIGFSILFNNYIDSFISLAGYLRRRGISCHFTAGGHYASLRYRELFGLIPELDSIVRFEGEYPVVELARRLENGGDWRTIRSIAFRKDNDFEANPVWPAETDLDRFPFPLRYAIRPYAFGKKFTNILAGRGCSHNCSFCNTRAFYKKAGCPVKRLRSPEQVAAEMNHLYRTRNCRVFLFDDDDFPVSNKEAAGWTGRFCSGLRRLGLDNRVIWKISCRPDETEEASFAMMKNHGLRMVFLGIEDGTDAGLRRLNKNLKVSDTLAAIDILRKLKLGYNYGFLLFRPDTSFAGLKTNLDFLERICAGGYSQVTFLRLIPLYDTRVSAELEKAGRLKIKAGVMDYELTDPGLNRYCDFITETFGTWLWEPAGLGSIISWARNYFITWFSFYDDKAEIRKLHRKLTGIIEDSNRFLIITMRELADLFSCLPGMEKPLPSLDSYKALIARRHTRYVDLVTGLMTSVMTRFSDHLQAVK